MTPQDFPKYSCPSVRPADLTRIRTYPIAQREHLVDVRDFGRPVEPQASVADFLGSLPDILAVKELRSLARAVATARRGGHGVVFALGAHTVKVGVGPLLIDLMERGVITALALNSACAIHDFEVAYQGKTSEIVADTIRDGSFGMVQETGAFFARATAQAASRGTGLGRALGEAILDDTAMAHRDKSLLATAARLGLPLTVHPAFGTDTVHVHPDFSGEDLGMAAAADFRLVCGVVAALEHGVWLNVGSSVVMPEIFLKAVSVARNLGSPLDDLTTANLDMILHYRPRVNVLTRPASRGIHITGHHEILVPLLRVAVLAELAELAELAKPAGDA